jgi:hypothetical protein
LCTFKANDGDDEETFDFPLVGEEDYWVDEEDEEDEESETGALLELDHMYLVYENSSSLGEWQNESGIYTEARFSIVDGDTLEDCSWITSCGVRLFHVNNADSFSVDLHDYLERSKRKRETLEREKETMGMAVQEEGEECSGGPICCCFSLTGCTISLRKKQREREREREGRCHQSHKIGVTESEYLGGMETRHSVSLGIIIIIIFYISYRKRGLEIETS